MCVFRGGYGASRQMEIVSFSREWFLDCLTPKLSCAEKEQQRTRKQSSDPGVATSDDVARMSQSVCETGGTSAPGSLHAAQANKV